MSKVIQNSLEKIKNLIQKKQSEETRIELLNICELLENSPLDIQAKYIDQVLKADGECSLLDIEIYGTQKQKETFNSTLHLITTENP